jgi:S1-C subfamily serine protease
MNKFKPSSLGITLILGGWFALTGVALKGADEPKAPEAAVHASPVVENAVVKVFSTTRYPEPFRPWMKQAPQEISGSGVVIEGKRILTNAHVVLYASQVQVQPNQSGEKISATVVAIAPGIDLAVLQLDDETFFETHPPVQRASVLPQIKDSVLAYGFPTGGASLSITKGIVSRIEFTPYNFPVSGLRIQIDAAINPGNSGGPAIADDKMIGLAFSHLGGSQNISYIIPNEEINLFLEDIADGKYDGKPALFDETQKMQSPTLRAYLNLDKAVEGVIVRAPIDSTPSYPLKQWDVITHIGSAAVDDEGMIKLGSNLRVRFDYLVQKIVKNGTIPLTLVRAGKTQTVEVPVSARRPMLIPDLQGAYPSFFIYGPLVFSTATTQLIFSINRDSIDSIAWSGSPLMGRRGDAPAFEGEQLVLVSSPFLPHKLAKGYFPPLGWVVKTIDGIPIRNMAHLVEVLRDDKNKFVTIEFFGRGTETIVFPRSEISKATEDILNDNGIRAQGSEEALAVWNAKPGK